MSVIEINYPEHKHPHGVENTKLDEFRIWVCEECTHIFTDEEAREAYDGWGHRCKSPPCIKGQRCESHLEPYLPEKLVASPSQKDRAMNKQTAVLYKHITANLRRFKNNFPEEHQALLILQACKDAGLVFLETRGSYGFEAEFEDIEL